MTFIVSVINGLRVRGNTGIPKGATLGVCFSDRQKNTDDRRNPNSLSAAEQRIVYNCGKQELIGGLNYRGILSWADCAETKDEMLKYEGYGDPTEEITKYGTRLAKSAWQHVQEVAKSRLQRLPESMWPSAWPEVLRSSLTQFGFLVYDSSSDDKQMRIAQMKWFEGVEWTQLESAAFDFKYITNWHHEVGHQAPSKAASDYIDRRWSRLVSALNTYRNNGIPPEQAITLCEQELDKIGLLYLGAGAYHRALQYPSAKGIPTITFLDHDRVDNQFTDSEACTLVNLVAHWERGMIHRDIFTQGENLLLCYLDMVANHTLSDKEYRAIAEATFSSEYDLRSRCVAPYELDDKLGVCAPLMYRNGHSH